jgi:hypothetical protein
VSVWRSPIGNSQRVRSSLHRSSAFGSTLPTDFCISFAILLLLLLFASEIFLMSNSKEQAANGIATDRAFSAIVPPAYLSSTFAFAGFMLHLFGLRTSSHGPITRNSFVPRVTRKSQRAVDFENLEGFPADWKTNAPAFVKFEHPCPSFLEYGDYPYLSSDNRGGMAARGARSSRRCRSRVSCTMHHPTHRHDCGLENKVLLGQTEVDRLIPANTTTRSAVVFPFTSARTMVFPPFSNQVTLLATTCEF